jgi:DNA-binding LytR/AlgR family response regulator
MKMRCIIADDEPLARKGIENYVREIPFLEHVASCSSAMEVIDALKDTTSDLLFLDIQMPKMTGLSLLRNVPNLPLTIITTAYPDHALESYELDVMDYLVKPIPFDRFVKAVNKAKDYHEIRRNDQRGKDNPGGGDFCFIKCDRSYEKIFYKDILFIEAMLNYVVIHVPGRKYISYLTLKSIEEQLPSSQFLKISKSYVVNILGVTKTDGQELSIGNVTLQIGRAFKEDVMTALLKGRLLKR